MKEVKSPKKPLIYYYGIVLLVILVFYMVISPLLTSARVTQVDYGTFMKMIEEKNVGSVEVSDSEIVFTDKENKNRQSQDRVGGQDQKADIRRCLGKGLDTEIVRSRVSSEHKGHLLPGMGNGV